MVKTYLKLLFFIGLAVGTYSAQATTPNKCAELLSGIAKPDGSRPRPKLQVDGTDGLIAYLSQLLEHQIIGDRELLRLIEGLEKGTLENPIHEEQTWVSSAHLIHREEIQEYIKTTELNQRKLLEWARKGLKEKERVRVKREETRIETEDVHQKMELNPLPAGRFQTGEESHKKATSLTYPIDAMSTQTTQKQWVEAMGENPSEFADGEHTIVVTVKGKQIKMQPDNPVEMVTWWSAAVYANKRSEMSGLKPAYDFTGIGFVDVSLPKDKRQVLKTTTEVFEVAARGALGTKDPEVSPKINAPKGNIYQAEGFRLPTEAEQEYLLRAAGTANGTYHFGDSEADLKDHGWYSDNANRTTHPVAQLKPLIIDGKEFYDLHGNVWEWGHDWLGDNLTGGENPHGPKTGSYRVVRGGSWYYDAQYLRSSSRSFVAPDDRSISVGFRLVRTRNP